MTFHTTRRRLLGAASSLALLGSLMAGAYTSQASPLPPGGAMPYGGTSADASAAPSHQHLTRHFWDALELEPQDAWTSLRADFQWQDQPVNARVQEWIDYYQDSPHNVAEITERARPWLAWITQQVESRGLPGEIALIPFVESSFDPKARSHFGAVGLWQIMPRTGDALGLKRNGAWDGRNDVVASTRAALDYIEMQADQWYEGDLQLSLAAYNAGAGTVNNARRAAQARGLAGDYWDLNLPSETMAYVPKLMAISRIINDPERYGVNLPEISGSAAFAKVSVTAPISLNKAAALAGVTTHELSELNPGLKSRNVNPRHTRQILVPAESAATLRNALSNLGQIEVASASDETHVVESGDTLNRIAMLHSISPRDLARWNGIDNPQALQPGQQLTLSGR
ncbi:MULTISPECIES: transglycosylase SLT domain-containing protein [unclassified Halomonas]|uniref:Transglycosylase SLT domain-containing protein n=3 Tax=Halomonas TaxID=2745 RepID=A0AAU7L053_9GAMM|nr:MULTISPECIES: transglycosylase SLT domain-containing protein [Halomonas]MBR9770992.1 transglycosylase SLT domain-containing protein [Gammaproteobacteria bacterium]MBY6111769.1 transglycosylase SLT domain-containing protein [Halomonas sp. DP1Y21-3]PTL89855.1 lytic transglycosylase [Halomonas sp. SYSU XM8]KJZ09702.1 lysozyme-like domain containing protein [Halomonas sp. S2151]MBR9880172.1 transglycosylase SLT domain-containing protein [Gammaproteobacteria bacterium]